MKINKTLLARTLEGCLVILGTLVLVAGIYWLSQKVNGGINNIHTQPLQGIIFNSQLTMGQ